MGGACLHQQTGERASSVIRQLSQDEARALFDYRDGKLYWRRSGSGRRRDRLAMVTEGARVRVVVGREKYRANVLVWNWHHGKADGVVQPVDGDPLNCQIENLEVVPEFIAPQSPQASQVFIAPSSPHECAHSCPMCNQSVAVPTFDMIVQSLNLPPLHRRILRAVWSGKGHPVLPVKIFGVMYEDDPNGGPSEDAMYRSFKVGLCRLRERLEGSGVGIENVAYGRGYKLVFEGK